MTTSDIIAWPENWPKVYNASREPCDMLLGPCSCGAWHTDSELVERLNGLVLKLIAS